MGNVSDKCVQKIKTHILCSITFFPKIFSFMRLCRNIGKDRQFTDETIMLPETMRFACRITKANTRTHIQNM